MLQPWLLVFCSLIYIGALFAIAWYGDRRSRLNQPLPYREFIYSLSLSVYCTSWTYYGAVGRATTAGWGFFPIYLGPILLFIFGYPFLKKVAVICREQNITTIADFISSRYGKSSSLAVLVTLVAVLGTMPYIALQLKAVALSFDVLAHDGLRVNADQLAPRSLIEDTGFIVAALMAVFSILFGTRYVSKTEQHEGIILAIAFESMVKLFALLCVCLFAIYGVSGGFEGFISAATALPETSARLLRPSLQEDIFKSAFVSQTALAMVAIFCLPRQFHVTFVESSRNSQLKVASWLFPLYLLVTCVLVVPITIVGSTLFAGLDVNPDMFVLTIPIASHNGGIAMLAFLGGLSAATSMVIVAVITLSTMVCNDIVMPLLFKLPVLNLKARKDVTGLLLTIRRVAIILILLLSYIYYQYIRDIGTLASIGLIAFVAASQFAPAIIGGVYWKRGHRRGARMGLIGGSAIWMYTLFLPTLADTGWLPAGFIEQGLFGIAALKPYALLGLNGFDPVTHGAIWSLSVNLLFYVYFSWQAQGNLTDRLQATDFTHSIKTDEAAGPLSHTASDVRVGELSSLGEKFIGEASWKKAFADYTQSNGLNLSPTSRADEAMVRFTEHLLGGAIGASSARLMVSSVSQRRELPIEEVVSIVGEASQALQFNQELLYTTFENIDQGISVVDQRMRLVAWNQRYVDLFDLPSSLIVVGRPIVDVLRYSVSRGDFGPQDKEDYVNKRLGHMQSGEPNISERVRDDGSVLEIRGNPIPGGGYVTSYSDITEHKNTERKLLEINDTLEQRVKERTQELSTVNQALRNAIDSKVRFLAAVNHDMMQPLNAARLYTSALQQNRVYNENITGRISRSLQSAEEIIKTLLDISRFDMGAIKSTITTFAVADTLNVLDDEFAVIAAQRDIRLRTVACSLAVRSDAHLLRRVLQNFLTNALRYARGGQVLLGCRRVSMGSGQPQLRIEVWDSGVGIAETNIERIFDEFERLDNQPSKLEKGVGLGLAIVRRISKVLDHPVDVKSRPGHGSVFSITVPLGQPGELQPTHQAAVQPRGRQRKQPLEGLTVLCVDNDDDVLNAMNTVLTGWGCQVIAVASGAEVERAFVEQSLMPDLMLVDYHLDNDETGVEVMNKVQAHFDWRVPGVLITADLSDAIRQEAEASGYQELRKPVNPGALRSLVYRVYKQTKGAQIL